MMRVTSYAMENTIAVEERDESSRCYSKGNVDYYIISNNDQVKISWQIGLNAYVIGGQISENEAKEIIGKAFRIPKINIIEYLQRNSEI